MLFRSDVGDTEAIPVSGETPSGSVEIPKVKSHSPIDRFAIALHSPEGILQTGPRVCPPEKKAAQPALSVPQSTFSESGLSAKHAELRGLSAIFRK